MKVHELLRKLQCVPLNTEIEVVGHFGTVLDLDDMYYENGTCILYTTGW